MTRFAEMLHRGIVSHDVAVINRTLNRQCWDRVYDKVFDHMFNFSQVKAQVSMVLFKKGL